MYISSILYLYPDFYSEYVYFPDIAEIHLQANHSKEMYSSLLRSFSIEREKILWMKNPSCSEIYERETDYFLDVLASVLSQKIFNNLLMRKRKRKDGFTQNLFEISSSLFTLIQSICCRLKGFSEQFSYLKKLLYGSPASHPSHLSSFLCRPILRPGNLLHA